MIGADAATIAQLENKAHICAMFIEVQYASGTQRYCFAGHNIDYGGFTWNAISYPMQISPLAEKESGEAIGYSLKFTDISVSSIAQALLESIKGQTVKISWVVLDDGYQVIGQPIQLVSGKGDARSIEITGESASVTITVESSAAYWSKTNGGRFTDAEQRARYPGDRIFSYIGNEDSLAWPARTFFFK